MVFKVTDEPKKRGRKPKYPGEVKKQRNFRLTDFAYMIIKELGGEDFLEKFTREMAVKMGKTPPPDA